MHPTKVYAAKLLELTTWAL